MAAAAPAAARIPMPARPGTRARLSDAGQVRFRIPPRPRLSSARHAACVARRHGRRQRRHRIEIRRPPRNAGLHRRKLHAMHGVHHGLPGHRPAELLAGCGAWCCKTAVSITSPTPANARRCCRRFRKIEERTRAKMNESVKASKTFTPFKDIIRDEVTNDVDGLRTGQAPIHRHHRQSCRMAYQNVPAIFRRSKRKTPGAGGMFSIFVSDLCKGCGECVRFAATTTRCAWRAETEELNAEHDDRADFLRLLPDTPQKFLGLYNDERRREDSRKPRCAIMLMVRRNYEALVSRRRRVRRLRREERAAGDRFRHRSLHAPAVSQEGRPPARQGRRAGKRGLAKLQALKQRRRGRIRPASASRRPHHHGPGRRGRRRHRQGARLRANTAPSPTRKSSTPSSAVMRQDAFNHRDLQAIDGRRANGMSVMFMGAHTGCNTVYGSTPPSNPHPYPWMNSLFQDGATIWWLLGEASSSTTPAARSCPNAWPTRCSNARKTS